MTIAIIGAGMAGLSLATALKTAGKSVRLFDKGRGAGGRMSTRRTQTELGELSWDHGAQYFTARNSAFDAEIQTWIAAGMCAAWTGRVREIDADGAVSDIASTHSRYVGVPGMNGVIRHLAEPHQVMWGRRVSRIEGSADTRQLIFEDGAAEGPFDSVIVATPCEQAVDLLEEAAPALAEQAAAARSAPCWCVMLAYEARLGCDFDAIRSQTGPLSWMARNASKPWRADKETWVLHASPAWSKANLERSAEAVAEDLSIAFQQIAGAPSPVFAAAHRWRYAQIETAAGQPAYWDAALGVGACGDWCIGPRVEAAWESGQALAEQLLR